eukprot:g7109.t1
MNAGQAYTYHCGGIRRDHTDAEDYTGVFENHGDYARRVSGLHVADLSVITINQVSDLPMPYVARDNDAITGGAAVSTVGWGYTNSVVGPTRPVTLQLLDDLVVDNACGRGDSYICTRSPTGIIAVGDSGGPLFLPSAAGGDGSDDTVHGVNVWSESRPGELNVHMSIPFFVDGFIAEKVRDAETIIENAMGPPNCPANPSIENAGPVNAQVQANCRITFVGTNPQGSVPWARVSWNQITRNGADVRFDIDITQFTPGPGGQWGSMIPVYEQTSLLIRPNGQSAMWVNSVPGVSYAEIAESKIIPGSNLHKVRILHSATGVTIFEDGMKLATYTFPNPPANVIPRFEAIAYDRDMTFTYQISNIRMNPVPAA